MTATPVQTDVGFVQSITKQLEGVFAAFEAGTLPLNDALLSALGQAKRELCAVNLSTADERVVLRRDLACGWIDAILLSRSARAAGAPAVPYMISAGVRAAAATAAPAAPSPLTAPAPAGRGPRVAAPAPAEVAAPVPAPVAAAAEAHPVEAHSVEAHSVEAHSVEAHSAEAHSGETDARSVRSGAEMDIPDKRRGPLVVLLALLVVVLVAAIVIAGGVVHIPAL